MKRAIGICLVLTAAVLGQANFNIQGPPCSYSPPTPCGTGGDPEGLSWNGNAGQYIGTQLTPTVDTQSGSPGMPCSGTQYLRVMCANSNSAGTPIPGGG